MIQETASFQPQMRFTSKTILEPRESREGLQSIDGGDEDVATQYAVGNSVNRFPSTIQTQMSDKKPLKVNRDRS